MLKKLNKLVIYVANLEKTFSFYKLLGFKVAKSDNVAILSLGNFSIEAVVGPTDDSLSGPDSTLIEEMYKGEGIFILIEVEDVDQYCKELQIQGVEPSTEPKDWKWGRREFVVRDPDKYKLVFYQNI